MHLQAHLWAENDSVVFKRFVFFKHHYYLVILTHTHTQGPGTPPLSVLARKKHADVVPCAANV